MPEPRSSYSGPQRWQNRPQVVIVSICVLVAIVFGLVSSPYYLHVGVVSFLSIVLAVTLRPLLVAGEASFCHGSFYALGAYTVAILATDHGWNVWLALPVGGLVAALGAVLIGVPSLRATGSYFFLMTFGFLIVVNSLLQYLKGLTGGFSGIVGIPSPSGIMEVKDFYFLALVFAFGTVLLFVLLDRSRWGLELRAIGDSVDLAQAAGVDTFRSKLVAFILGAFVAGIAGGIFASYLAFIAPATFSIWLSIYALTYVILGGRRYVAGAVVGAMVLGALPVAVSWSETYVGIIVAATTLLILILLPKGIITELIGRFGRASKAEERPQSDTDRRAAFVSPFVAREQDASVAALSVRGLSQDFGGVKALTNVDLDLMSGELLGIIGPNGAGKTTLFNVISGFQRQTSGEVHLAGRSLRSRASHQRVQLGLTRTFQSATAFDSLTVLENVLVGLRLGSQGLVGRALTPVLRLSGHQHAARTLISLVGLDQWALTTASELPYGARRRLGVAVAVATNPSVLCLDEPMAGLSDPEVEEMVVALQSIRTELNVSIVLIEHRMALMLQICDRLVALDFGQVIAQGLPAEVASNPAVVEAYVGQTASKEAGNV